MALHAKWSSVMIPSVIYAECWNKNIMLSVAKPNVVMLIVVAPLYGDPILKTINELLT